MSENTKELPSLHANSVMMPPTEQLPVAAALKPRLVKISQINFRIVPYISYGTRNDPSVRGLKLQSRLRNPPGGSIRVFSDFVQHRMVSVGRVL